jgi:glycosyltransferase involved in cell wall biosynthesis
MGIDTSVFETSRDIVREPDLVVAAGRLVRSKGFDLLIRACASQNLRLVIAGEGPERGSLEAMAKDVRVSLDLRGALAAPALADLFQRAGVVVVPSRGSPKDSAEGAPLVVMEALACGAAVVATETGGLPGILPPHALTYAHPDALRPVILAALARPDRFRDAGAARRFDRVAVADLILRGIGAGSSRTAALRRRAATPTGCSARSDRP